MANVLSRCPQWAQDLCEDVGLGEGLRDDDGPMPAAKDILEHRSDAVPPRGQLAEITSASVREHSSQTEAHVLGIADPDVGCPVAKLEGHLRLANTVGTVDPYEHGPMVCIGLLGRVSGGHLSVIVRLASIIAVGGCSRGLPQGLWRPILREAMAPPLASDSSKRAATALPPGPRLPGPVQTVWYTFWQPSFFAECRARFGPTWSMRLPGFPSIVVTRDRDAVRRLLTGDPLARRHGNDVLEVFLGERSLMVLEPAEHLARRRVELPPFHGEAVRSYTDRIRELVSVELAGWGPGGVVETHPRVRALTLAIILELVLGVSDPDLRAELAALFDWFGLPRNNLGLFLPRVLIRRAWWNLGARPGYARLDRIRALLSDHIVRVREDPALDQRGDVLSLLARAQDENGARLSDVDLRDELVTLVTAGHETTATAIAWGCDLLAHNPDVARELRDRVAGGDREYPKAFIKELLRARTVAYAAAGRHCLEPFPIGGWVLGPETLILIDAQGLHGDPELYPEPDVFRPERFLERPPDGYAYLPFGGGSHRCLGAALATLELELFFEAAAQALEMAPAGPPAHPIRRGVTLAPNNKGRVHITPARTSGREATETATEPATV